MRIVEIIYAWPAETFICRHARALTEQAGIQVVLASKSPAPPHSASAQSSQCGNVPVTFLPNFDHSTPGRKLWEALRGYPYARNSAGHSRPRDYVLLRALDALQPDVIHFHFGTLAASMAWAPQTLGIPYTLSLRGSDVQVWPLSNPDQVPLLAQALTTAAGIHAVCDAFGDYATRLSPGCPPPMTIRTVVPIPSESLWRGDENRQHFVAVGRLHWRKAFHDLVRAMVHLPDATLDIVGDGPEREHLLYLIDGLKLQDRIRLHGSLPYDQFQALLLRATAFVQSSVAEGFSNALAEAMALGMPVFATPVGGTDEVIRDGQNGVLIPTGDPAGMAEKLRLATDSMLLKQLGLAARETACREFSADTHAQAFRRFFEQVRVR